MGVAWVYWIIYSKGVVQYIQRREAPRDILIIILVDMAVVVLWTTPDISKGLALLQIQDIDFINEFRILIL